MKVYLVWHYSINDNTEYEEDRYTGTALLEIFDTKEKAIEYVKNFEEIEDEYFVKKEELSDFIEEHRDIIDELKEKEPTYFEDCDDEEILSTVLLFHIIDEERYDPDHNARRIGCGSWSHILFTTEKEVK